MQWRIRSAVFPGQKSEISIEGANAGKLLWVLLAIPRLMFVGPQAERPGCCIPMCPVLSGPLGGAKDRCMSGRLAAGEMGRCPC